MKRTGSTAPSGAFTLSQLWNGLAEIRFYENAHSIQRTLDDGTSITEWEYDEIIIRRPYFDGLEEAIEANYSVWLQQAKAEEEARNPVDAYQLRADVDYLEIIQTATNPYTISTMSLSEPASDPDVLEKSRRYYPARWSIERLQYMVLLQKLTAEDYQSITGEAYSA